MNTDKADNGFTLIELLVVIAIIGILAAIAVSQFSKYRTMACNSGAQFDLSSMQMIYAVYLSDFSHYPSSVAISTGRIELADGTGNNDNFTTTKDVYVGSSAGLGNSTYGMASKHVHGNKFYYATSAHKTMRGDDNTTKGAVLNSSDIPAPE